MVVAVEQGLENIKKYLESCGFKVYDFSENKLFDAVVFKDTPIGSIPVVNSATASLSGKSGGVFLVCAKNKSPEEVASILSKKSYTNLF